MLGYTGEYNGKMVTVMGTGMGQPQPESMPRIHHYGVKQLIRVGSTGSIQSHVNVNDIVIAQVHLLIPTLQTSFVCQVKWQHWQIFNC